MKTILSLCDYSGIWSQPYRDAGYHVIQIDLKHGHDVRLLRPEPFKIHGIINQPPCTELAGSGARWWAGKGETALIDGLALVDACLRAVAIYQPSWWVLENPVGRLRDYLGEPTDCFDPCDFAEGIPDEAYTKRTLLWGNFNLPSRAPVPPVLGSKMHMVPGGKNQAEIRSMTPRGFAKAFFEANP